ncbi:MAG TPA: carboxypeptidase regulatory-like domain-containing protein [Candidatus Limnocylindrales bacterium]|nr:carboxypeptidase regulatory-like domain-containing protein [Candidatus Limnocylindrales bacterium]
MILTKAAVIAFTALCAPAFVVAGPNGGTVSGKVTLLGTTPKLKPVDVSKEPSCLKMHWSNPLYPETIVTGPGNSLANVVVYVSSGDPENVPPPATSVTLDQQGCHYTTHVLAFRVGQEVRISNSDPFPHNVHPLAKINREWNRMQLPGTPPFSYAYDHEEFIPIKCNLHSWMQGYFVVLKTSFFAVTGEDGRFTLPVLPPGRYTLTAWHESLGTQSKEITVNAGESQFLDFTFAARP